MAAVSPCAQNLVIWPFSTVHSWANLAVSDLPVAFDRTV
jgi:hypothetical protein